MPPRAVLAALLFALCFDSVAARGQDASLFKVEHDVPVKMRDGIVLRADVYRPLGEGPFPVLVQRTPYGKKQKVDEGLLRAGFIVVLQDARGRYASDGQYESFVREETHDGTDGYDTVEWAAKLPGSTGKVGLFGVSYPAFLAWRAAGQQPPSLGAMAAFSIPMRYTDLEGPGTIRPGRRLKWWQGTMSPDQRRKSGGSEPHTSADAGQQWNAGEGDKLLHWLPWQTLPDTIFGDEAPFVKAWLKQPWREPWQLDRDAVRTLVPNLNICGWYDHCNGSIDLHQTIHQHGGSEPARRQSRLIVGPWSHNSLGKRQQGEIDFGPSAEIDRPQLEAEWFGHWLRGDKNDVEQWSAVRLFVMGSNEWRNFSAWPPKAASREWFLASGGHANTPAGDGQLAASSPPMPRSDQYDYDPREPVPTQWTAALFTVPADQAPLAKRQDILVYQTPPLTEAVETIGYPKVELHVSSSCPDTDFFARLIDVSPDGKAIDVASGMVRARYRESLDKPRLLLPNQVTAIQIKLRPTAHRFLAGHRIRLDITSSDFPNYDRNHNTAADQNADAELVTAHQTIHHGGSFRSRLVLPVVRE